MNVRRPIPCLVAICILLAARDSGAGGVARRLGGVDADLASLDLAAPTLDCRYGNLNPPAGLLDWSGWTFAEHDIMALKFDAQSQGCGCADGFQVVTFHVLLMNLSAGPLSVYLDVGLDEPAQAPTTPQGGCWLPTPGIFGGYYCTTQPYTVELPLPGIYDVMLPLDCPCAFLPYEYFLRLYMPPAEVALIGDLSPTTCRFFSFAHMGPFGGWSDRGYGGSPLIWVDAVCCAPAVQEERASWSRVKTMYR